MKVPYGEGVAIHTGLESCVLARKGRLPVGALQGEALTEEVQARY